MAKEKFFDFITLHQSHLLMALACSAMMTPLVWGASLLESLEKFNAKDEAQQNKEMNIFIMFTLVKLLFSYTSYLSVKALNFSMKKLEEERADRWVLEATRLMNID